MVFRLNRLLPVAVVAAVVYAEHVQAHGGAGDGHVICYGVWSRRWAEEIGSIPESVMLLLNRTENVALKEAVLRHECPFGIELPGQVTWPSPPPSLRGISGPLTTVQVLMVAWSFLPYLASAYIVLVLVLVRGTRQLWVALWMLLYVGLNELLAKSILREARPGTLLEVRTHGGLLVGSCLESCGMPSTHAGVTSGLFTLVFLDATTRIQTRPRLLKDIVSPRCKRMGQEVRRACARRACSLPWFHQEPFAPSEFVANVFFWFAVLYPTSMARVILFDHTPDQVMMGKLAGVVSAMVWWWIVRNMRQTYNHLLGETVCCGLLVHNFPLDCTTPLLKEPSALGVDGDESSVDSFEEESDDEGF